MKEDENIDSLINSLMNNTSVDVSDIDNDWKVIQSGLKEKKKRRVIWWWLLPLILGVSVFAINEVISYHGEKENFSNQKLIDSTNTDSENSISERKLEDSAHLIDTIVVDTSQLNNKLGNKKEDSTILGFNETTSFDKENVSRNTASKKEKIKVNSINKNKQTANKSLVSIDKEKGSSENIKINLSPNKPNNIIKPINDTKNERTKEYSNQKNEDNLKHFSRVDAILIPFSVDHNLVEYKTDEVKQKKNSFSLYFEPIYVRPRYNESILRENFEAPFYSYSIGLNYNRFLSKKIEFLLGIDYSVLGFNSNFSEDIEVINEPPVGVSTFDFQTLSINNKYKASYLNLSSGLKFNFLSKRKFQLYGCISPEVNFLLSQKVSTNNSSQLNFLYADNSDLSFSSKVSSSLNIGLGVNFKLKKDVNIFLQPNFKYMYLGYNRNDEVVIKPYVFGLRTGFSIKF